jgi:hypothetical protein
VNSGTDLAFISSVGDYPAIPISWDARAVNGAPLCFRRVGGGVTITASMGREHYALVNAWRSFSTEFDNVVRKRYGIRLRWISAMSS